MKFDPKSISPAAVAWVNDETPKSTYCTSVNPSAGRNSSATTKGAPQMPGCRPSRSRVVSGGGSSSPLFMQIFADVFGIPASRSVDGGGAALGAAICAAAAAGLHPDIETASARMTHRRETFEPIEANRAVYVRMADAVYHDIRNHTDALFERAYPIFH